MLARLHHYEELEDHVAFFKRAFGTGWEAELMSHGAVVSRGELMAMLKRKRTFSAVVLPRLRSVRWELEQVCPGHSLANPPPAPRAASPKAAQRVD